MDHRTKDMIPSLPTSHLFSCVQDEHIDRTSNKPGTLSMANTGDPNTGGQNTQSRVCKPQNPQPYSDR